MPYLRIQIEDNPIRSKMWQKIVKRILKKLMRWKTTNYCLQVECYAKIYHNNPIIILFIIV